MGVAEPWPWQVLLHSWPAQPCWKGILTQRSQGDSRNTDEIFWELLQHAYHLESTQTANSPL